MGVKVREWKGAWWIFINHQGRRKSKRVGTGEVGKRAALDAAARIQAKLTLGEGFTEDRTPRLADYVPTWIQTHAKLVCKPRTVELYESMFKRHILPALGHLRLSEITREQVRLLLASKAEAGLKRGTLKNIVAPLRQLLNQALEDGRIAGNPAARLGRQLSRLRSGDEGKRTEIFTERELAHLLAAARAHCPEHADLITTVAWTGMRQGEAFGLQWQDIDFHNGFVEVRRTVGYRQGQLLTGSPKSRKARRVDLPQALQQLLRRRSERAVEQAALTGKPFCPWVFPNRAGLPLDASHFTSRVWHPLLAKAGLRGLPFHTLRHTYASLLIMRSENLTYIKEQLGHSSIQVTVDLYGHLIPGMHRGAIDALAEATGRNPGATTTGEASERDAELVDLNGGPCRGRTCGPLIKSQLLYQLS